MSDNDMFTEVTNTPETTQVATPPSSNADPFADKLNKITNEQGQPKYKDIDTALDALAASQQFIETLKAEKAEEQRLRIEQETELTKMGNINDFVNKLNPPAQTPEQVATPQTSTGLSAEEVSTLLQNQLQQRDAQSQQERNLSEVTQKLSEMYGDKSSSFIQQRATELGTTVTGLRELSQSNPKMALAILGNSVPKSNAPTQTSVNLPHTPSESNPIPKFDKGTTRGGLTSKEVAERFNQSKAYTNARLGVTS